MREKLVKALSLLQEKCLGSSICFDADDLNTIAEEVMKDFVILTHNEAHAVAGIVGNHIREMGSIYNNDDKFEQENELRKKLGLIEYVKVIKCTCWPMAVGTNPDCKRHGLRDVVRYERDDSGILTVPTGKLGTQDGITVVAGPDVAYTFSVETCDKAYPPGFRPCTREKGHEGPCALPIA